MAKKLSRLCFCLTLIILGGCASIPTLPPGASFESRHGFLVWGDVNKRQLDELDKILDAMEPDVVSAIHSIEVTRDHSRCKKCSAYCKPSGHILFLDYAVNDASIVWHEAAHAHHFTRGCRHNCKCDFCSEWQRIAGKVYTNDEDARYGKPDGYPGYGMVSEYSSKSYWEDIAEMTAAAYCFKTGRNSALNYLRYSGQIHSDPRYAKKLKLLAKYGFISQKLCDEILE